MVTKTSENCGSTRIFMLIQHFQPDHTLPGDELQSRNDLAVALLPPYEDTCRFGLYDYIYGFYNGLTYDEFWKSSITLQLLICSMGNKEEKTFIIKFHNFESRT